MFYSIAAALSSGMTIEYCLGISSVLLPGPRAALFKCVKVAQGAIWPLLRTTGLHLSVSKLWADDPIQFLVGHKIDNKDYAMCIKGLIDNVLLQRSIVPNHSCSHKA